jgi:hypothetical protein
MEIPKNPSFDLKCSYHEEWDEDNHQCAAMRRQRLFYPRIAYIHRELKFLERLGYVGGSDGWKQWNNTVILEIHRSAVKNEREAGDDCKAQIV